MSLSANIYGQIKVTVTGSPDLGTSTYSTDSAASSLFCAFSDGTGNYQARKAFVDQRTLAASANEDLDLSGALLDPLGSAVVFTAVKAILIKASPANTNSVIVKPGATNGFLGPFGAAANTIAIKPGEMFLVTDQKTGWPVTAATADLLNIANGGAGTAVTYSISIIGV